MEIREEADSCEGSPSPALLHHYLTPVLQPLSYTNLLHYYLTLVLHHYLTLVLNHYLTPVLQAGNTQLDQILISDLHLLSQPPFGHVSIQGSK